MRRASRALAEFLSGVVAGLAIGYVMALLLAPDEGTESRTRLKEGTEALRETPRQIAEEVQARVQRAVEEGRQAAAEARSELERSAGLASVPGEGAATEGRAGEDTGTI
jgi:gas vesicle protein